MALGMRQKIKKENSGILFFQTMVEDAYLK